MSNGVLGIDPGTRKAGYALLDASGAVLAQGIEDLNGLFPAIDRVIAGRLPGAIALGCGTNAAGLAERLRPTGLPIHLVDERETTLRARSLYFADHPPRGWRRLIPRGMLLPPRPIDDYAAILIGRRLLFEGLESRPS